MQVSTVRSFPVVVTSVGPTTIPRAWTSSLISLPLAISCNRADARRDPGPMPTRPKFAAILILDLFRPRDYPDIARQNVPPIIGRTVHHPPARVVDQHPIDGQSFDPQQQRTTLSMACGPSI